MCVTTPLPTTEQTTFGAHKQMHTCNAGSRNWTELLLWSIILSMLCPTTPTWGSTWGFAPLYWNNSWSHIHTQNMFQYSYSKQWFLFFQLKAKHILSKKKVPVSIIEGIDQLLMMTFTFTLSRIKSLCGPSWIQTSARIWQHLGDTELKPSDNVNSSIVVVFCVWQECL